MPKGRKAENKEVLELRGSRHAKGRDKAPELQALLTLPKPPRWLSKGAKKLWRELGLTLVERAAITGEELDSFAALCQELDTYHECQKQIADDGLVLKIYKETKAGKTYLASARRHPAHAVAQLAIRNAMRLAAEFGLTPASRSNVRVKALLPENDDLKKDLLKGFG